VPRLCLTRAGDTGSSRTSFSKTHRATGPFVLPRPASELG